MFETGSSVLQIICSHSSTLHLGIVLLVLLDLLLLLLTACCAIRIRNMAQLLLLLLTSIHVPLQATILEAILFPTRIALCLSSMVLLLLTRSTTHDARRKRFFATSKDPTVGCDICYPINESIAFPIVLEVGRFAWG